MKLLIINPNTSQNITDTIADIATAAAGPTTEIEAVTAPFGVAYITSKEESAVALEAILQVADERAGEYDAVAVASSSDTGLDELRSRLVQPVTGMSESAMHFAVSLGPRFAMIDMLKTGAPLMQALVELYGHTEHLASIRLAMHLEGGVAPDPAALREAILRQGRAAVVEDGAQALIVGRNAAPSLTEEQSDRLGDTVLDGITSAVRRAEQLSNPSI